MVGSAGEAQITPGHTYLNFSHTKNSMWTEKSIRFSARPFWVGVNLIVSDVDPLPLLRFNHANVANPGKAGPFFELTNAQF